MKWNRTERAEGSRQQAGQDRAINCVLHARKAKKRCCCIDGVASDQAIALGNPRSFLWASSSQLSLRPYTSTSPSYKPLPPCSASKHDESPSQSSPALEKKTLEERLANNHQLESKTCKTPSNVSRIAMASSSRGQQIVKSKQAPVASTSRLPSIARLPDDSELERYASSSKLANSSSSTSPAAKANAAEGREPADKASILSLPCEVIDTIGFFCALTDARPTSSHTEGPESDASSRPHLLGDEDVETFLPAPPSDLRSLLLTCRRFQSILNTSDNPHLYARIFRTRFDTEAIERRFGQDAVSSSNLANELQRRCMSLKRMRQRVRDGKLKAPSSASEGQSPTEQIVTEEDAEMTSDLWLAYMMALENDGLNMQQLHWANMKGFLKLYHSQELLESAIRTGYPPQTADRALAVHLNYLLTDPRRLSQESRDESDENLFVLRPFVFAAHKYDAYFAPWNRRILPSPMTATRAIAGSRRVGTENVSNEQQQQQQPTPVASPTNPFFADLQMRDNGMSITHCGRQIEICPPNLTHGACFSFFMKVERDPAVIGLNSLVDANEEAPSELSASSPSASISSISASSSSSRLLLPVDQDRRATIRNPVHFRSINHDKDVTRLLACTSPHRSRGLSIFDHVGEFEGSWEGRFTFFDFDSYRDMLGGKIRSLYEGPFGEQPQVWKIREHVVKVNYADHIGGKGSLLNSGFHDNEQEPDQRPQLSREDIQKIRSEAEVAVAEERRSELVSAGKRTSDDMEEGGRKKEQAIKRSRLANADEVKKLSDEWENYPSFDDEKDAATSTGAAQSNAEGYEILLSGSGHSAWGRFILRGRIRSWDGMMIMTKEYRPDGRGRWLYRGYVVGGGKLVGRWRDTFTPEDMSGYEGCFLLHRRSA